MSVEYLTRPDLSEIIKYIKDEFKRIDKCNQRVLKRLTVKMARN